MDEFDYVIAWCAYLFAASVLLLFLWRISASIPSGTLRAMIRAVPTVLLLVPARAGLDQAFLAPAVFVVLFEFGMSPDPAAGRLALQRIGIAVTVTLALALAWLVWRRVRQTSDRS